MANGEPLRGLDDRQQTAHAWGRYRELMEWTALVAGIAVAAALVALGIGAGR